MDVTLPLLIVVPTLDSYQLLPDLLSSLQRQSYKHWRILFVDGPSCDAHREWLISCCRENPRCSWVEQDPSSVGIFGAMSQGFEYALPDEWVLFWGSDDVAAGPNVFQDLASFLESSSSLPDVLVCDGRYFDPKTGLLKRIASFDNYGFFDASEFRRALFFGSTPPHQSTLFGPRLKILLSRYSSCFKLSADLDYFLKLSRFNPLHVRSIKFDLVHMSLGGISGRQLSRRMREVIRAYFTAFGVLFVFPLIARYVRRIYSFFK